MAEIRRMPAEWEPHERTLIQWPVRESLVHPENAEEVCAGYAAAARAVLEFEAGRRFSSLPTATPG